MRQYPAHVFLAADFDAACAEVQMRRLCASPVGHAVDCHGAAAAVIHTLAYWVVVGSRSRNDSRGRHAADAVGDCDAGELAITSAANACTVYTSSHSVDRAAADGDGTARAVITAAADASAMSTARGCDVAAADTDGAAGTVIVATADARRSEHHGL